MKRFISRQPGAMEKRLSDQSDPLSDTIALLCLAMLTCRLDYQADSFSPLMAILSGQPRLAETLRLQALECVRQRISVHYTACRVWMETRSPATSCTT